MENFSESGKTICVDLQTTWRVARMNNYTIWARVLMVNTEDYEVDVTAIALTSDIKPRPGDAERQRCRTLREANELRDKLVERLRERLQERGDTVLSVDVTLNA